MRILRSPAGLALRTAATTFVAAGAVTVLTVSVATRAASFVVAKRQVLILSTAMRCLARWI